MILADQLGARILGNRAKLVVHGHDPAARIGDRPDGVRVERGLQVAVILERCHPLFLADPQRGVGRLEANPGLRLDLKPTQGFAMQQRFDPVLGLAVKPKSERNDGEHRQQADGEGDREPPAHLGEKLRIAPVGARSLNLDEARELGPDRFHPRLALSAADRGDDARQVTAAAQLVDRGHLAHLLLQQRSHRGPPLVR